MGKKTPPYSAYPKWTEAKFFSFIRSALRRSFTKWGPKYAVINKAKRQAEYEWWSEDFKKRLNVQWEYQCSMCNEWRMRKEVEVDHIESCGSLKSFEDLPGFVERMFCGEDGLRVLCKECHAKVTKTARNQESLDG